MSQSLPEKPSLEHLKKEAWVLLSAHRAADATACERLRLLGRLSEKSDSEILAADLSLTDAQMTVALDYGFNGWPDLKRHVEATRADDIGRDAAPRPTGGSVCQRAARLFKELQDDQDDLYQRSQIWALMVALHATGREDVDYTKLMAVSGWSGQFVYNPKPADASFFEPYSTVADACRAVGVGLDEYRGGSGEEGWAFIRRALAADQPVLGEHGEYGLFVDTADEPEPSVRYCVIPFIADGAWWTQAQFDETFWRSPGDRRLFTVTSPTETPDPRDVARDAVARIVRLATEDYWDGWRKQLAPNAITGLDAMEQYAVDVADPAKAMQDDDETNADTCFFDRGWGCYAIYPQFMARECTGRYLDSAAELFEDGPGTLLRRAAGRYHQAFGHWREWEKHLGRAEKFGGYDERWGDPDHRAAGGQAVLEAVEQERQGIDLLCQALARM